MALGQGAISLGGSTVGESIALELSLSATSEISLGSAAVYKLAGKASASNVDMLSFRGKSNRVVVSTPAPENTTTYNISIDTSWVSGYVAGKSDFTYTIPSTCTIASTSTGTAALRISGFTAGDTITIINNGKIIGCGGAGGNGANVSGTFNNASVASGGAGGAGGSAISLGCPGITIKNYGQIAGGGGGGGGGAYFNGGYDMNYYIIYCAGNGGGGGAGIYAGGGGAAGTNNLSGVGGYAGYSGTSTSGGASHPSFESITYRVSGGTYGGSVGFAGGTGGSLGQAGQDGTRSAQKNGYTYTAPSGCNGGAGGAAGLAVAVNGYTYTMTNSGILNGSY